MAPYIASKHAVNGLVKTVALELGPFGIRVNAIGPGPIDNRMMRSLETQYSPENPDAVRTESPHEDRFTTIRHERRGGSTRAFPRQ